MLQLFKHILILDKYNPSKYKMQFSYDNLIF